MPKFNVVQHIDPRDPAAPKKFYACLRSIQSVGLDYIADELADKSSISKGDVMSIVTNLIDLVPKELASGRTVNLGKLGTFMLSVNSEGYEKAEDVGPEAVKKVNVRFRPSSIIKDLLGKLKFERVEFI